MNRTLIGSLALVLATASVANAQAKPEPKQAGAAKAAALTWADLTGDWEGKAMRGKTDSVITTLTTTFAADKKIWVNLPNRKPVAAHLITMAGDSIVYETDSYDSITRPGHKTTLRLNSHIANHKAWGTFHAAFDDGKTLDGTHSAAHKIK